MSRKISRGENNYVIFFCPGCNENHAFTHSNPGGWTWNGDSEFPTFSPSLLVGGVQWAKDSDFHKKEHSGGEGDPIVCHSFITNGRIEYLSDSTHALAGQTVDIPDWPYT